MLAALPARLVSHQVAVDAVVLDVDPEPAAGLRDPVIRSWGASVRQRSTGRRSPARSGSSQRRSVRARLAVAPHALRLGVGLDQCDLASSERPVRCRWRARFLVDREDRAGRAELRRHVADRRPVWPAAGQTRRRQNSTNFRPRPCLRSQSVIVSTTSVRSPLHRTRQLEPDGRRMSMETAGRARPAASTPRTPRDPGPLTIVVCCLCRTGVGVPPSRTIVTWASRSMLTFQVDDAGAGRHDL